MIGCARASEKIFSGGTKVDTGPPNLIGFQALSGPMPLKDFFCPMGVDLRLKVYGLRV